MGQKQPIGDRYLDSCVVVLVNEQRLNDHQDLVHEWPHELIQLVQDAVNDLQIRKNRQALEHHANHFCKAGLLYDVYSLAWRQSAV
jgi:hypothetical protein